MVRPLPLGSLPSEIGPFIYEKITKACHFDQREKSCLLQHIDNSKISPYGRNDIWEPFDFLRVHHLSNDQEKWQANQWFLTVRYMPHNITLITTIAASLGLALMMGLIASRLKLPPLVGYLIAGVMLGPATPGFVADAELSSQLAEIGVILLMFGVGLHFSFDDLLAVRRIALPGAIVQIGIATALGAGVATLWGWSLGASLVFGLSLSVASTVVLIRALEQRGLLQSANGRIAVGWLIVEDLATVLVLVLLPSLAGWLDGGTGELAAKGIDQSLLKTLMIALGKISIFVALMLVVGRRVFPWLLGYVAGTGSRELFTLCVITAAVGIAYGSARLFGVSFALGAFFAGMV
ncbi:MAG: cation:proton antiporter, partial [Candidatus Manganitrophaceae bacterium]